MKKIWSYLFPVQLESFKSKHLPSIELNMHNGNLHIDGEHVNYSFGSLHLVFRKAIKDQVVSIKKAKTVLILGFGAGSIAKILNNEYQLNLAITGVEFEPAMLEVAEKYGNINRFEQLNLVCQDAADFMAQNKALYDVIFIDLFIENKIPAFCFEHAFQQQLNKSLNSNGIIIWNTLLKNDVQLSDGFAPFKKLTLLGENCVYFFKK